MPKGLGFKKTGKGPTYGKFSFPTASGFTGSTGKVQQVRAHTRATPKRKFASGGVVQGSDGGSALVRRTRPVTQFDAQAGGKGPVRPGFSTGGAAGYSQGGKVSSVGAAIKMVKQLMSQGNSAQEASRKAAARHGVNANELNAQLPKQGMVGDPQLLSRGGMAQAVRSVMGKAPPRPAGPIKTAPASTPGSRAPIGRSPPTRVVTPPPAPRTPERPMMAHHGVGSFSNRPMFGRR